MEKIRFVLFVPTFRITLAMCLNITLIKQKNSLLQINIIKIMQKYFSSVELIILALH